MSLVQRPFRWLFVWRLAWPWALIGLAVLASTAVWAAGTTRASSASPANASAPTSTADRLRLSADATELDAWPAVRVLIEAGEPLDLTQVLERLDEFHRPTTPHANLGVQRNAVWLHLPITMDGQGRGHWQLDLDYASVDRVDVHVITAGRLVHQARLGDHIAYAERPQRGRSHSVELPLAPNQLHEVLMRVETTSSMILPLRLMREQALSEREASIALVQGVAAGIGLCLAIYSLVQGLSLRDLAFLSYSVMAAAITLFFMAYHGLGTQHLWPGNEWLTRNASPFFVMPAVAGGLLFVDQALQVREMNPRLSQLIRLLAVVALVLPVAFLLGALDYRTAHLAGTLLGPTPLVLCLPVAWLRARDSDRAAQYILLGWGVYIVGVLTMAALLRGWLDLNAFTANAFQAGALLEMLTWLQVLGVRVDQLRARVQRADREQEDLRSLANTDALTGLPNRRGIHLQLADALTRISEHRVLAVYLLDLDGFKAVNDQLGHDAGDELLRAVAHRLRQGLRSRDVVSRLGGDEFVILVDDMPTNDDARRLGQKLIDNFREPFIVRDEPCQIGLTIGYALAPLDSLDATELLRLADGAMYSGKRGGKNRVQRTDAVVMA